ncbi:MAG: hypothetical protein HY757_09215 [Nitrospirae bacterium]|nr:hypothetical protein [Nitrospirota bacterium]
MKRNILNIYVLVFAICFSLVPLQGNAQVMNDYTAYPPFVTSAEAPNILMVLDHSGSMQFPAYIGCDFNGYSSQRALCGTSDTTVNPEYNYNSTRDYYGYFRIDKYYQYGSNKFFENDACSFAPGDTAYKIGNSASCISGNLLNWASMSRIDVLRKVLIGGKSVSTQGNAHTLRAEGGWRKFTDDHLGCIFDITGGSYPQLAHTLTISSTGLGGTCGYLDVWANGSTMWGKSDAFRYVYQSVSGNFDAKLLIVTPPTETGQISAKAGLEIRATTDRRSQHVMAMATNGSGLQFAYRPAYNNNTTQYGSYVAISYPVWVRIIRSGNTFTYYYSSNGTTWTTHGSQSVPNMPATVMIGMGATSYSSGTLGKAQFDEFICNVCSGDNFNDGSFNTSIWSALDINTSKPGNQVESCGGVSCPVSPITAANLNVDVPSATKSGVIQALADKDGDGNFDPGGPRFGLMTYNSDNEGCVKTGIAGANMSALLTALQDEPPYNGTPTGEALNEAWDYYIQSNAHTGCNNTPYIGGVGSVKDPWYDSGTSVTCRKSFVLLISDGEWNGSGDDPVWPARSTHVNDIRPDLTGTQSLKTFSVYSFGYEPAGINSMQQIGMYGSFDDYDSNTWPYNRTGYPSDSRTATLPAAPCDPLSLPMDSGCREWDTNGDGLPDTYYKASEGDVLEAQLIQAISDILKQSSSGTAVSVLATTGEGEGAVYQAYFYPEKLEGIEPRKWIGFVQALFVDKYGNLREDTNSNDTLDMASDYILEMEYDVNAGTLVKKYSDTNADGQKDSSTASATVSIDAVSAIWKGGENLWQATAAGRNILTTTDGFTSFSFETANSLSLQPYLRAADISESDNIINWTRGDDLTGVTDSGHIDGYRKRDLTLTIGGTTSNNVWKLGDIVYSTPTVVGKPMENYDLLYGDSSYSNFRSTYMKRRQTVYVGSNDGMLHAFNAGCYDAPNHKYYGDADTSGNCVSGSHSLGQELWAFIPRGILPHLKWSTLPDYTHVYTVDQKPKVTDVNFFTSNTTHPYGWGTILIGSYRYGGKTISCPAPCNSTSPEYFALDITDPLNPRLLWTFTDPGLGLTMSYPSVAKVGDRWFAIIGSGPTDYDSGSNLLSYQNGNIYALELTSGSNGVISAWTQNTNFWKIPTGNATAFLANPITVDVDIDYDVDVMYIGENYQQGGNWNTLMRRITTNKGGHTTPSQWTLSTLGNINSIAGNNDVAKRITAPPSAAMDDRANLWVFFGTGQFFGTADKNQTDTGGFYAIKDGCWDGTCSSSYSNLLDISGGSVMTDGTVSGISGNCGTGTSTWSSLLSASYACDGWSMFFDNVAESVDFTGEALLHSGEKMLGKPLVLGGLVTWATYIPGINSCAYAGESNVYAVYYKTGTAYKDYVFKEQKQQTNPSNVVARVKKLGVGLPSSLSAQVTTSGSVKAFVQQSTGSILQLENLAPISLKSGVTGWKSEQIP